MEEETEEKINRLKEKLNLWKKVATTDDGEQTLTDQELLKLLITIEEMGAQLESRREVKLTKSGLKAAYLKRFPGSDNKLDWKHAIKGKHPKVVDFVGEGGSLNTLPGRANLAESELQLVSAKVQEKVEEGLRTKWKQACNCSAELNISDESSLIEQGEDKVPESQNCEVPGQVDLPQNCAAAQDVNVNLPPEGMQRVEKTKETTESEEISNVPKVLASELSEDDHKTENSTVANSVVPSQGSEVDDNTLQNAQPEEMQRLVKKNIETSDKHASEQASDVLEVQAGECSNYDDRTENPTAVDSITTSQRVRVDDIVDSSKQTIRNLVDANRKFKEIIKDPYCEDESSEHEGNNEGPSRKRFLAPQRAAEKVTWSESDDDVSFDDIKELTKNGTEKKSKRIPWSQDEMDYIREGIRRFGVGDWAKIRDYYPFAQAHQNSVAIKDKYRNMVKNGQIV